MNEKGLKPQLYTGLSYNQFRDSIPQRKKDWDGIDVQGISMKKPYDYKNYSEMSYSMVEKSTESIYPTSRKETLKPGWTAQSPVFDNPTAQVAAETIVTNVYYPVVSGDDGTWLSTGTNWQATGMALILGPYGTTGDRTYIRFPSITIEKNATIQSAILTVCAYSTVSDNSCNVKIYGNDVDNASAPTNTATSEALALTSTSVSWDAVTAFTANAYYTSPDLSSIVSAITSRGGWASKNALMLVIHNNSSTAGAYRLFHPFDSGNASYYPKLTVTFAQRI
jgi:hypothetical protein